MKTLKETDLRALEQILGLTQSRLKSLMKSVLERHYTEIVETKEYLYAVGDIPIALVAHLDTVFKQPAEEIFFDPRKNAIWSPDGLGADDRAGVFSIIQILRSGLRPHIILTTDEEIGGLGAIALAKIECPFPNLKYIVELDRRGTNDCVFYECDNVEFIEYIEGFGFNEAFGSFSDISIICPAWGIAGVNLSVGYRDEHSYSEVLFITPMMATIEKVKKMLIRKEIPTFKYIPSIASGYNFFTNWDNPIGLPSEEFICTKCKHTFFAEEVFPVVSTTGSTVFYCPDCIGTNVEWCPNCGEAFEVAEKGQVYCVNCQEGLSKLV